VKIDIKSNHGKLKARYSIKNVYKTIAVV